MFTQQEFNWLVSICNIRSTISMMSSGHWYSTVSYPRCWLSTVSYPRCCIGVLIPRWQFTFSGLPGLIKDIRQSPADPQPSGLITPGNFCNYCKERVKRYRTFFTLLHFDILHSTDVTGRCCLGGIVLLVLDTFSIHWMASHNWNSILLSKVLKILSYVSDMIESSSAMMPWATTKYPGFFTTFGFEFDEIGCGGCSCPNKDMWLGGRSHQHTKPKWVILYMCTQDLDPFSN